MALADSVVEEFLALDGDDPVLERTDTDDNTEDWLWPIDPDDLDGDGSTTNINIAGAGDCSVRVTVNADPTVDGTTLVGLTQVDVVASNPSGVEITKTIMKRRY